MFANEAYNGVIGTVHHVFGETLSDVSPFDAYLIVRYRKHVELPSGALEDLGSDQGGESEM